MSNVYDYFERIIPGKFNLKELHKDSYNLKDSSELVSCLKKYGKINYAGVLGGKLIDVDIDDKELYSLCDFYLPKTLSTKKNNNTNHYFYLNDLNITNNSKILGIEIRVNGHTILPPSTVDEIEREWACEIEPISAKDNNIIYTIKKTLFHHYFNKNYPKPGERNNVINLMTAWLCYSEFKSDDILSILLKCGEDNNDDDREKNIESVINKYEKGERLKYRELEGYYNKEIIDVFKEILKNNDTSKLDWMNEHFCYIELNNEIWDIDNDTFQSNLDKLKRFRLSKFNSIKISKEGKKTIISVLDTWGSWSKRFTCKNIGFFPGKEQVVNKSLNIWKDTGCGLIDYEDLQLSSYWKLQMSATDGYIFPIELLIRGFFTDSNNEFDEAGYHFFIKWLAYPLQNKGEKLDTAVVLYSKKQGVGKGSLCQVMSDIYGDAYVRIVGTDLSGQFNDYLFKKQFVFIDEIRTNDKTHVLDYLKTLITEPTLGLNRKFQPLLVLNNTINFILATNYDYALPLTIEDRRFFVVNIEQKPSESFFINFHKWRKDKGSESFYKYLMNIPMGDFNPHQCAPLTEAKESMIELSKTDLNIIIDDIWQDFPAVITVEYAYNKIKRRRPEMNMTYNSIGRIIKDKGGLRKVIDINNKSTAVWILKKKFQFESAKVLKKTLIDNGVVQDIDIT